MRLSYRKATFVPPAILLAIAMTFLNIIAYAFLSQEALSVIAWLVITLLLLFVVGISPFLTEHELTDHELILRQGLLFKATIPLRDIRGVKEIERGPAKTGVFFDYLGTAIHVTTQRNNLILIELRSTRRFRWALAKKADKIYFDTLEHGRAVRMLNERIIPASPNRSF
ncbi:MAG: hypothetical protein ABR879_07965 [Methanomassiliicoccales archaeon]